MDSLETQQGNGSVCVKWRGKCSGVEYTMIRSQSPHESSEPYTISGGVNERTSGWKSQPLIINARLVLGGSGAERRAARSRPESRTISSGRTCVV